MSLIIIASNVGGNFGMTGSLDSFYLLLLMHTVSTFANHFYTLANITAVYHFEMLLLWNIWFALVKAQSLPGTLMGVTQPPMRKEMDDGYIKLHLFFISE